MVTDEATGPTHKRNFSHHWLPRHVTTSFACSGYSFRRVCCLSSIRMQRIIPLMVSHRTKIITLLDSPQVDGYQTIDDESASRLYPLYNRTFMCIRQFRIMLLE